MSQIGFILVGLGMQGLLGEGLLVKLATDLSLDLAYLEKTLAENSHPVSFSQRYLL